MKLINIRSFSLTKIAILFSLAFFIQGLLFVNYINREVAPSYILHGDPTWYIFFNYKLFNAYIESDWGVFLEMARTSPWGILLFLETTFLQLIGGSSRATVSSINLVYYFVAQIATFLFFYKFHKSKSAGAIAVLLLLSLSSPFRRDGPGLNIGDFHFDLVLFFMLLVLHYMVAASHMFRLRNWAVATGAFAGIVVASRLVSFFLFVAVFGAYAVYLLVRKFRARRDGELKTIFLNYYYAIVAFISVVSIPLWIARHAIYNQYFRFLFEKKFSDDRAGLYTWGDNKTEEAWQLLSRMVKFDFGTPFFLVILAVASTVIIAYFIHSREKSPESVKMLPSENLRPVNSPGLCDSLPVRREFYIFLTLSAIASFALHLSFSIKSDHLTRMTAAPIFVGFAIWGTWFLSKHYESGLRWIRYLCIACLGILICIALYTQTAFYFGVGRHHTLKSEMQSLHELYSDMSRISSLRGLKDVAISVDRVDRSYELGALLSYFTYEYEHNGIIRIPRAKLGGNWDEPIDFDKALSFVKDSDFVLLGDLPYDTTDTPFHRSIKSRIGEIHDLANQHLCRYKDYLLFGSHRVLYLKPKTPVWSYVASSSTEPRYGPEGLIEGKGNIWHAHWKEGDTQWVEFSSPYALQINSITIQPQSEAADRAPKDFKLQARDGNDWVDLLVVQNAVYTSDHAKTWQVEQQTPYKSFRLFVTRNNGSPGLMTIQNIDLGMPDSPDRCNLF